MNVESALKRGNYTRELNVRYEEAMDKVEEGSLMASKQIADVLSKLTDAVEKSQKQALEQLGAIRMKHIKRLGLNESRAMLILRHLRQLISKPVAPFASKSKSLNLLHHSKIASILSVSASENHLNINNHARVRSFSWLPLENTQWVMKGQFPINLTSSSFAKFGQKKFEMGKKGQQLGEFRYPFGIAVHPITSNVYICDDENHRVQVLDSNLNPLYKLPATGAVLSSEDAINSISSPFGLAFSDCGELLVVVENSSNSFVIINETKNTYRRFGSKGSGANQLSSPYFAAFDRDRNIYITDCNNSRVCKYDETGQLLGILGEDTIKSIKGKPWGTMINDDDELMILMNAGKAVLVFDCASGNYLRDIPIEETRSNWNYLFRGPDGTFGVTDFDASVMTIYSMSGELLWRTDIRKPLGAAFNTNGRLYAVRWGDGIVQYYDP